MRSGYSLGQTLVLQKDSRNLWYTYEICKAISNDDSR